MAHFKLEFLNKPRLQLLFDYSMVYAFILFSPQSMALRYKATGSFRKDYKKGYPIKFLLLILCFWMDKKIYF